MIAHQILALLLLALPAAQDAIQVANAPAASTPAPAMVGRYRLSGARELRPREISDDGVHTYARWDEAQELPAVFALNARGQEEMVDGYMRGDVYTIDRIIPRLVFRIDAQTARADRVTPR